MWGIFGKPLKRAIWNTLGLHAVLTTCLRLSSVLADACVAFCLFLSTGSLHVCCIQIYARCCCFARCTTETIGAEKSVLWWGKLGASFVWVKSGYSETIAWRKVRLTKQQNADLTTNSLWAMPQHRVGACEGTPAAGLRKIEEICPHSQAG